METLILSEHSIEQIYETHRTERDQYVNRGNKYSNFTIGSIMPTTGEQTQTSGYEMGMHYNVQGAQLVNHLANKYVNTMFPINRSFFKLSLEEEVRDGLIKQGLASADLDTKLVKYERSGKKELDRIAARPAYLEALKHLIITGNCLSVFPEKTAKRGKVQIYALDEYVIQRDLHGDVLEIITRDSKSLIKLQKEVREQIILERGLTDPDIIRSTEVNLYTRVLLTEDDKWEITQAVDGIPIGEPQSVRYEDSRYLPLAWSRLRRENYGRGHVEDYAAVFHAVEVLNEALITGAAILLDFKFLVDPSSVVNVNNLNNSATGTYHYGRKDDINMIEKVKSGDLSSIVQLIDRLDAILKSAFLFNQQRDADRVTAEEVKLTQQELQTSHGGIFGSLAELLQRPLAYMLMKKVEPKIKDTHILPEITTGLDAMGRGSDNDRLAEVWQDLAATSQVAPEILQSINLDWTALYKQLCNGRDVEYDKYVMTEEQIKQKQQQEQQKTQGDAAAQASGEAQGQPQPQQGAMPQ